MGVLEKLLETYVAAATRLRWFILTTVLLSSLILAHVYLDIFGTERTTVPEVMALRQTEKREETLKCLEELVRANLDPPVPAQPIASCKDVPWYPKYQKISTREQLVERYGYIKYIFTRTENTLKELKNSERALPLVGLQISESDYLLIISLMLCVFQVGVWLNARTCSDSPSRLRSRRAVVARSRSSTASTVDSAKSGTAQ